MEEKKESKLGLGIVIGLLIAAVVGLGIFIVYDKVISNNKKDNKESKVVEPTPTATPTPTPIATAKDTDEFDGTKAINGYEGWIYKLSNDNFAPNIGLTATLNSDKKGATIRIEWSKYFETYGTSTGYNAINNYNVTNFSGNLKDVLLAGFGQSAGYETAFYLMEDGTVEYTPIKHALGNNGTSEDTILKSYGKLAEVSGVVKLAVAIETCNTQNCIGDGYSIIGIKEDGTFYDLSKPLLNTNYYQF